MVCLWLFSVLRDILTWSRAVLRDNEDADYGSAFSFEPDTHNLKEVRGECMSLKSARSCQLSGRELSTERTGATQPPTTGHGWSCGRGQGERCGTPWGQAHGSGSLRYADAKILFFSVYTKSLHTFFRDYAICSASIMVSESCKTEAW